MTSNELHLAQWRFTRHIGFLINYAYSEDFTLTFGEAWRNKEVQQFYVNGGRSRTLNSKHLDRLAVDFNFFVRGSHEPLLLNKTGDLYIQDLKKVQLLGNYWMSLDGKNLWGGDFNRNYDVLDESFSDAYHFQTSV